MVKIFSFNSFNSSNSGVSISGSERFGIDLIKNCIEEGNKVLLVGPYEFCDMLMKLGELELVSLYKCSQKKSFRLKFGILNLFLNYVYRTISTIFLIHNLKKIYSDVLYFSISDFFPDVIPPFIVRCNKWYVMSHHLYSKTFSFRSFLGRLCQYISFIMFQFADKVVVTNQECENFLKKNFRINNLQRIFLGRDLEKFFEARSLKKDFKKIVYVGRFNVTKGFLLLPEIFNELYKKDVDFSANIIGNGSEDVLKEFRSKLDKYNLNSKVTIKRGLSNEDLKNELASSYILIQPSNEEGFSFVVLEGLASNLHVVAFDLPIFKEVYHGFDLNLVEKGNITSFSSAILKLLKSKKNVDYPTLMFQKFNPKSTFNSIFN
jgi:glycosyltransferase involved in cell wall biosynthesis